MNINELNKFGSVDGQGNEYLYSKNTTNAWRAAYNMYGGAWYHGLNVCREAKKMMKFVTLEVMAGDSESSDEKDSLVKENSFEDEEDTDGSRSMGSVDSVSSWESAILASSASLYPTLGTRLQE